MVFEVNGVGAKEFGMSLETQEKINFLAGYPGMLVGISRGCPQSLRKHEVYSWPLKLWFRIR